MHFISSAMASFCLETTVEDAMQTVRDAGFDSLDFPLSVYSRPQDVRAGRRRPCGRCPGAAVPHVPALGRGHRARLRRGQTV